MCLYLSKKQLSILGMTTASIETMLTKENLYSCHPQLVTYMDLRPGSWLSDIVHYQDVKLTLGPDTYSHVDCILGGLDINQANAAKRYLAKQEKTTE